MPIYADSAPNSRRMVAGAIDCLLAFVLFWAVVEADAALAEEQFLAVVGLSFLLGGVASTYLMPGQSPGKYLTRLAVLRADGGTLGPRRQVARDVSRLFLAFLVSIAFIIAGASSFERSFAMALATVACAEALVTSLRLDSRSIVDLVFTTRVVRMPPVQPYRAPAGPMYSATDAEFGNPPRRPKGDA